MAAENHLFNHNRLQCFNDAVFSIVSTILVLPIRKLELKSGKESLQEQIDARWPQLIVYLAGFLVIAAVWESHVLRFRVFSRVDDVLIWLNLASLLFTSFLPFTCALEGTFPLKYLPMLLVCGNLMVLEILEVVMIVYAFHRHELLEQGLKELSEEQRMERRNYMLLKKLVNPTLYILAGVLSLAELRIAWTLMVIVILSPCINRLIGYLYCKFLSLRLGRRDFDRTFGNYIDKDRVEFFSDGVFAIVSTLLVLDITAENFPTKHEVAEKGIQATVGGMKSQILTYGGTFVMVALLCFVHHSLLHCVKNMNQLMLICNNISLAFVGLAPLISATLDKYAGHGNQDSRLAVQMSTAIVFMASIMQALMFTIALWNGPSSLHPLLPRAHYYLVSKLAIIPCVTILVYCVGFTSASATDNVYHIGVGLTPLIFILSKVAFVCWSRRHARPRQVLGDLPEDARGSGETSANEDEELQNTADSVSL